MCFFPSNDFSGSFCLRRFGGFGVLHRFGVRFVCHGDYPLFMPKRRLTSERNRFVRNTALIRHAKLFARVFFKKTQKFLREIHAKTFTFGTNHAYTVIPPFNINIISSYSSLFRILTGCKSISPNVTSPEQSDI